MKRVKMYLISLGVAATMAIGFLLINFSGVVAGEKSENINADIEGKINADKLLKWCFLYTLENFLNANRRDNYNKNDTIET